MTRELFVVCVLRDSAWIDAAEFYDEDSAFLKSDELRDTEIDAKVVRRWVGDDHVNPETLAPPETARQKQ